MPRPWTVAIAIVVGLALMAPAVLVQADDLKLPPPGYVFRAPAQCPFAGVTYAPCEDQMQRLANAAATAKADNKLLLIVLGADWCPWCRSLETMIPSAKVLGHKSEGFDYGARFALTNIATSAVAGAKRIDIASGLAVEDWLLARSGTPRQSDAIPYLAVLDPVSGKVTHRATGDLQDPWDVAQTHDAEKLRAALREAYATLRQ